ncbi:MAG: PEP-CTERM sorting domain-containing protein [Caulobacterales bacterium]|nr:PEP-CTERM sorting domain-containing protein [Caulobacterales bacterium]
MRFQSFVAAALAAGAMLTAAGAQAAVLVSDLPTGSALRWSNKDSLQTFLVRFTLAQDSLIDGFGIVHDPNSSGGVGFPVTLRYAADVGGQPGAITQFSDKVDTSTAYAGVRGAALSVAHFSPILFHAGSYWMGMAGAGTNNLTWYGVLDGGPSAPTDQRQLLFGALKPNAPTVYDLPFVVEGRAVPEPAAWALMILGFGLAGAGLRRRRGLAYG